MDDLRRKHKAISFINYNPGKQAALNSLDRAISSRGGGDARQAAARRTADEQRRKAEADMEEEDDMNLFNSQYSKPESSSNHRNGGGGGGSSREGGGGSKGKGKEREVYVPSARSEAEKKKQQWEKQKEDAQRDVNRREMQQRKDKQATKDREDFTHGGRSMELSDDEDLPEVAEIGGIYGRGRNKATSSKESSKSAGKRPVRRPSSSPPPSKLASPSPSPPPIPKLAPLPNFKKKTATTSTISRSNIPLDKPSKNSQSDSFFQPKASTSTSSSKRVVHDLDSPKRKPKTLDLDTSPSPSPSPPRPPSRKPNGCSDSSLDGVEDELSPQKAPRVKPKPKLNNGVVGVGGVANPFGVKTQPIASSSSSSSGLLQPSNSDAPFPGAKPSKLPTSKPSKITKTSSNKLPDSSEEEDVSEKDTEIEVGGVKLVLKARKRIKLTPRAEATRKQAEELDPRGEYAELVDTEEDEEESPAVDLRKKKAVVGASSSKGNGGKKNELKSKGSRIVDLVESELEAGMKDKAAREKRVKLYGEDDVEYETDHPHPNPELLCVFCSEPLPPVPSPKLLALIRRLKKLSHPAPTIFNPRAVSLSMIKSINACTLHRSESKQFPIAKMNGWPMDIDWTEVQRRVKDPKMIKHLGQVIESKDSNPFLLYAKERAENIGVAMARSAKGQYEVFEKAQPGYFGEIGQILFHQMLSHIFIPSRTNTSTTTYGPTLPLLTSTTSSPLTPSDFVYFVLIPELALRLIQQDLGLTEYIDAYNAMLNSRAYGISRFAAEEGEAAGGVLMQGWDEDGEEMHDGADDGILVSRRRRLDDGEAGRDGVSSKGKGKEREQQVAKKDASRPSSKGLRPPSSPPSDDAAPPRKKPTAVLSNATTTSSSKLTPNPFALASSSKRPRSISPNPPPPSKRASLSPPPPLLPKPIKSQSSLSGSTPKPPAIHPFFKSAKKEAAVVAPPSASSSSSSTSKQPRPKPKPALAPSSSSSSITDRPKPKPKLRSPVKIDLDSGEEEEGEEREDGDSSQAAEAEEGKRVRGAGGGRRGGRRESPKGKKGKKREEEGAEDGKKSLKRTHSMKRTESEKEMWKGMPSDEVDFDNIWND